MKIILLTTLSFTLISNVVAQTMVENSEPGLWEFTLEIKEHNKVVHTNKVKKCLTKAELDANKVSKVQQFIQNTKLQCTPVQMKNLNNTTMIDITCKSKEPPFKPINIHASYQSEKTHNLLSMNYTFIDKEKKELMTTINGQRLGQCS